jgi:hypothetical protein
MADGALINEAYAIARMYRCQGCNEPGRVLMLSRRHLVTRVHHSWCPIWQGFIHRHPSLWRPEYEDIRLPRAS